MYTILNGGTQPRGRRPVQTCSSRRSLLQISRFGWPTRVIASSGVTTWMANRSAPVGRLRASPNETAFVVTNHYFDLAAGHDDLVYIVNPRLLRVEGYTQDGDRETSWGQGSPAVADFFGCCNPARLAVSPQDGSFITAEKGIPRVKVYTRRGEFTTVVVGPPQLTETPAGIAGDRQGRIFVLDARAAKVRVFEKKPTPVDHPKDNP